MRVPFDPDRDGFGFINGFVNPISIADIRISTTRGRCGGMAFAALDYWHHRLPMPDTRELPLDGNPVADYIYQRQRTSMADNWMRYFHFMRTPDRPTPLGELGVARSTREKEFPKLKRLLDQGLPQPLGLVQSRNFSGLQEDHQVVGYGYELDGDRTRVFIWDNVHRHREDVLEFSTRYDPGDRAVRHSDGREFRGFFVERYSPRRPGYLSDGKVYRERSDDRVFVIYGGAKFWVKTRQEFEQLEMRWSDVTEVSAGSMAYIADAPGDGVLLREIDRPEVYVTYGQCGFLIPDLDTLDRLDLAAVNVRVLPRGSLAVLPQVPCHGTVLKEKSEAAVYLMTGNRLRHIPDSATFDARGLRRDRVGVVPDGALAAIPMGDPLPSVRLTT